MPHSLSNLHTHAVTLVFPHQLFHRHPAISAGRPVILTEDSLFYNDPYTKIKFHIQKLILHRASIARYGADLEHSGHQVTVLPWKPNTTLDDTISDLASAGVKTIHLCDPVDYLVTRRLNRATKQHGIALETHATPMLLSPRDWMDEFFSKRKKPPIMADFYRAQRLRMNLMIDASGNPAGGQWSHDADNQKKLPRGATVPDTVSVSPPDDIAAIIGSFATDDLPSVGSADGFNYPTTRPQALLQLDDFLTNRFKKFGPYEDAIHSDFRILHHSVLTPALNIGLITPDEIVDRALASAEEYNVPLNSLEGFIRQIVGWREFMAEMYRRHGTAQRTSNFWGFEKRGIPQAFYTGQTGIPPVDEVIHRANHRAYAHHIERLMIIGNFMLLCRIHPDDVYRWFMEMFIDSYDWVMVPNVYGMSQFADGGSFTTKPYLSGSNYVRKMSNWKTGDWCATWDGLFWTFVDDYQDVFASNHRMSMMAASLRRMDKEKRATHRLNAARFLDQLFPDS